MNTPSQKFKNSSNLTFSLAPGWLFVETEDWRADLEAGWVENGGGGDDSTCSFLILILFPFSRLPSFLPHLFLLFLNTDNRDRTE